MVGRPDIIIRPVTAADVEATSALLMRAWHATYDAIYGAPRVDEITARWHAPVKLVQQMEQPASVFLIAENDGAVVGTSYARQLADGVISLDRLYVAPDALGGGIGTKLMEATLAAFRSAKRVRLEVAPQNERAIAFYTRNGFRKVGSVAICGNDSGVSAAIYEKLL